MTSATSKPMHRLARSWAWGMLSLWAAAVAVAAEKSVVVGGKNFTEQRLMAEMTRQYLEAQGFRVATRTDMGSSILRQAQEQGQVDIYWEYTGTSLLIYNKVAETLSREAAFLRVQALDAEKGIVWLKPSQANNTWTIALRRSDQAQYGLHTMSDLASALHAGKPLTLASGPEFGARADGLPGLSKAYGFTFSPRQIKLMEPGLVYNALKNRQVDLAMVLATDGRVTAFDFVILRDDKQFFPIYAMAPTVRRAVLMHYPELENLLDKLSALLDDRIMQRLNAQVDVERHSVETVAADFLKQKKLI